MDERVNRAQSFDHVAEEYERGRPGYPDDVLDLLPVADEATVLDLAAGTGKLTRVLARRYRRVIAVEPLGGMRALITREAPAAEALDGRAEAIPLADAEEPVQRADAAGLRQFRSHRHRQQHQGSGGVASGAGLRLAGRALPLLPFRRHEGLQGRRAQLRAEPDRARRQDHRRDRQRLHGAAGLAEGAGAVFRRRARSRYVQAPQDHRDWRGDRFKEMLNWEYAGFFDIGMCLRNEYDAIIQHGTMTLVRRDLMEEVGGWATWCITEDTELGLRLMEKGYGAMYSRERFGHGLTPDHFAGYKKQRFRWAYGAMQIMKAHARRDFPRPLGTFWQKYHFVAGWLPWFADALSMIVTCTGAGLAGAAVILRPQLCRSADAGRSSCDHGLFVFKLLYSLLLYSPGALRRQGRRDGLGGRTGAHLHGGPRGELRAVDRRLPFMRTPKCENPALFSQVLRVVWQETVLLVGLLTAMISMGFDRGFEDPAVSLWMVMLGVQSLPYAATFATASISAMSNKKLQVGMLTEKSVLPKSAKARAA